MDLFCGAGGLSLGFAGAGLPAAVGFDIWAPAVKCYRNNFDHPVHEWDISEVGETIERVRAYQPDIVVGGPPCQDFSPAGKRREGRNATLTEAFASVAAACSPRVVVMENVPLAKRSEAWRRARSTLDGAGYNLYETVLNASLCGVPQRRRRFFCIAWKGDREKVGELDDFYSEALSGRELTVGEHLNGDMDIEHYYRHPRSYSRRGVFSVREPSPTIRGVNRPVPPNYPGHRLDTAPASTVRPLTTLERSLIQTFPRDWVWDRSETRTNTEQLIGNAVPAQLARFVAEGVEAVLLR